MSHKIKRFKTRLEWLNNRVIGGSSASAILGKNPYKTNVELWESLVSDEEITDEETNEIQDYGTKAEKSIRDLFALEHPQYEVIPPKENDIHLLVHNKYDFITGTLDGELIEKETGRKGILEIKTQLANGSNKQKWYNGNIPDNYYIQLLHYYLLDDEYQFAIIKCRQRNTLPNGDVSITEIEYKIERKDIEADIEYLLQKEIEFWGYVERKQKPPLLIDIGL